MLSDRAQFQDCALFLRYHMQRNGAAFCTKIMAVLSRKVFSSETDNGSTNLNSYKFCGRRESRISHSKGCLMNDDFLFMLNGGRLPDSADVCRVFPPAETAVQIPWTRLPLPFRESAERRV